MTLSGARRFASSGQRRRATALASSAPMPPSATIGAPSLSRSRNLLTTASVGIPTLAVVSRFLERLSDGAPIVADGGMGALLASAVARLRCPEEANLRAPDSVIDVHLGYI